MLHCCVSQLVFFLEDNSSFQEKSGNERRDSVSLVSFDSNRNGWTRESIFERTKAKRRVKFYLRTDTVAFHDLFAMPCSKVRVSTRYYSFKFR